MPVPVPASEISPGDYSEVYGTVTKVNQRLDRDGKVKTYDIIFFNGSEQLGVEPDAEFDLLQGWNNGQPEGSIRPGLSEDHAND